MRGKRVLQALVMIAVMITFSLASGQRAANAQADLTVERLVVCEYVQDREPVAVAEIFTTDMEKVYAFLEARNIAQETQLSFVWFYNEAQVADVALTVGQGDRWRTYSSKNLAGLAGDWRVEVQDGEGNVLGSVSFLVQ